MGKLTWLVLPLPGYGGVGAHLPNEAPRRTSREAGRLPRKGHVATLLHVFTWALGNLLTQGMKQALMPRQQQAPLHCEVSFGMVTSSTEQWRRDASKPPKSHLDSVPEPPADY